MGLFTNFNFNMTRIDEMQEETLLKSLEGEGKPFLKHQLTPRIVLEAIDEIRGRNLGFYGEADDEGKKEWEKTWDHSIGLTYRKDVYA